MDCDRAREAISARIDGEDPGLPVSALDAHLADCASCRDWQQRAHEVTRRVRLGGPFLERDLTSQVLAAVPPVRAWRRRALTQRVALAATALIQLAITVPLLFLGHDHGADAHAAHELGSFDLSLAIAFTIGAVRPRLSAGLAWPCGIAAGGLVVTAVIDLIGAQTIGADEVQHLIAAAGAALLVWQARTVGTGAADPALPVPQSSDTPIAERTWPTGAITIPQPEDQTRQTGGGDAAQLTGPDVAARDDKKAA